MTQPTFGIFQALEYGEADEGQLEIHNNEIEAANDYDDTLHIDLETFQALVKEYEVEEDEVSYVGGDPTDTYIIKHVPTGTFWKGEHYHDSWGDNGSFAEAYTDRPYQVKPVDITITEWQELTEDA